MTGAPCVDHAKTPADCTLQVPAYVAGGVVMVCKATEQRL